MIKYNSTIINPKNVDFVKLMTLGSGVEINFSNGTKCNVYTQNIEESRELVNRIYKEMLRCERLK